MRFLLTRRWILFLLAVVVLALGCVRLGEWQFHRLHDREQRNAWAERNMGADPAPVGDVLAVGTVVPQSQEWRQVTVSGTYDAAETVVVRYQTRDGQSGRRPGHPAAHRRRSGRPRGPRLGADGEHRHAPGGPAPAPAGRGRGRRLGAGGRHRRQHPGRRPVHARDLERGDRRRPRLPRLRRLRRCREGDARRPPTPLVPVEKPDLGDGPHLFYGIQWWFFGALALFGFCYLVYDEQKGARSRSRRTAPSDEPIPSTRT